MPSAIPQHVRDFLTTCIDSVGQLEVLLMLYADDQHVWTADEVSRRLRTSHSAAADQLDQLAAHGLLLGDDAAGFRFQAAKADTAIAVRDTAAAYASHRTTVIAAIHSSPANKLQSFADAFKLREDDSN